MVTAGATSPPLLSAVFAAASILLITLPTLTLSDDPCPYPCYPSPPAGGGGGSTGTPPATQSPPSGQYPTPTGYFPPPSSGNNYPYLSPPFAGGYNVPPPPPDPILPYFPFYFRKPPHGDQSSAPEKIRPGPVVMMITLIFVVIASFPGFFATKRCRNTDEMMDKNPRRRWL